MITNPLNLQTRLKKPSGRFDFIPLIDIAVIALGFTLLSSRFIFAPGITIDLPGIGGADLAGVRTDAVLTVGSNEMLLFEGAILDFDNFESHLRDYFRESPDAALLIRADRSISVQTLMELADKAQSAGVARIQVAASPVRTEAERTFFGTGR